MGAATIRGVEANPSSARLAVRKVNAHGPNVGPGMASGLTAPCDICASADALVDALVAETHLMCDLAASVDLRR